MLLRSSSTGKEAVNVVEVHKLQQRWLCLCKKFFVPVCMTSTIQQAEYQNIQVIVSQFGTLFFFFPDYSDTKRMHQKQAAEWQNLFRIQNLFTANLGCHWSAHGNYKDSYTSRSGWIFPIKQRGITPFSILCLEVSSTSDVGDQNYRCQLFGDTEIFLMTNHLLQQDKTEESKELWSPIYWNKVILPQYTIIITFPPPTQVTNLNTTHLINKIIELI